MAASVGVTKYGMLGLAQPPAAPGAPAASNGAVTASVAKPEGWRGVLSLSQPEGWVIGIGAVMLGLIAASTSIRVGKFKVSADAGDV